jgi:hypothetical protein
MTEMLLFCLFFFLLKISSIGLSKKFQVEKKKPTKQTWMMIFNKTTYLLEIIHIELKMVFLFGVVFFFI